MKLQLLWKCNKLIYIDAMDLPCFGASSVLVESELKLAVGIVVLYVVYRLVTCAKAYRGFRSLTLCSSINTSCCWRTCMKNDSQQFVLIPLLQVLNSSVVCSAFPHSCPLFNMLRRKPKLCCLFWCILCVLCVIFLLNFQFGQHMNYCRCCILVYIYHLNIICFVVLYRSLVCIWCLWFEKLY